MDEALDHAGGTQLFQRLERLIVGALALLSEGLHRARWSGQLACLAAARDGSNCPYAAGPPRAEAR